MVNDVEVSGNELVLQVRSIRDHDFVSVVGDQDTGSRKSDALAYPDVTRDSQVVELRDVWDRLESFLEVLVVSKSL